MTMVSVLPLKKRKPIIQTVKCSLARRKAAPFSKSLTNATNQKNKTTVTEEFKTGLHIVIYRAEGIDKCEETHTKVAQGIKNRGYNVVHWIKPGEELHTKVVEGVTPEWNQSGFIMLENLDDDVFLNVEVQRFNSLADPGSSSGKVVVGRVKIPIPVAYNRRKVGSFPLLRRDGNCHRLEGRVLLSMRLQRIKPDSPSQFCADDLFFDDDVIV